MTEMWYNKDNYKLFMEGRDFPEKADFAFGNNGAFVRVQRGFS